MLGLSDERFLRAVIDDAIRDRRAQMVLAFADGKIVGWSIAIIHPRLYWKTFFMRHPLWGLRALLARLRLWRKKFSGGHEANFSLSKTGTETGTESLAGAWQTPANVAWGQSKNTIAKHIDISLLADFQNLGIGSRLQRVQLDYLANRGVERLDAVVSKNNVQSIRFHHARGWSLIKEDADRLYVSKQTFATDTQSTDQFEWQPSRLSLPFQLGELKLYTSHFSGIRSEPNIFQVPPLRQVAPPATHLQNASNRSAYIMSCPIECRLPRLTNIGQYLRCVVSQYRHYFVKTEGSFESYQKGFNSKSLATLRRKVRKAESSNQKSNLFVEYKSPEQVDAFLECAVNISKKSYQHHLLGQGLPDNPDFRETLKRQASRDRFRGYLLFVEDTPVAYNSCPIYDDGVLLYEYTGYDPAYSKYSPGSVLQHKIIESLFEDSNIKFYDLCTGEGRHKELFATGSVLCANIYFFPRTVRYATICKVRNLLDALTTLGRSILERIGIKDRIKKAIRRLGR